MNKIYKYELEATSIQKIQMPIGAKILSVQRQHEDMCLWAMVNPKKPMESVTIRIFGTGNEILDIINDNMIYLGSVKFYNDNIVWHIFVDCKRGE